MNYFIEMNPNYDDEGFDYKYANDIDGKSQMLINNMKQYLINQFDNYGITYNKCDVEKNYYNDYGLQVDKFRLTCDYLGPSTYYAEQKTSDVKKIIINSRVFGGHMIWPSTLVGINRFDENGNEIKKSINTARSYCFKERLDYTIFEIREWYINSGKDGTPIFQMVLDGNRNWFENFGNGEEGYKIFLFVFTLNHMVDSTTFEPFDFESYDGNKYNKTIKKKKRYANDYIPKDNLSYENYVNGTVSAIAKRDVSIKKINHLFKDF